MIRLSLSLSLIRQSLVCSALWVAATSVDVMAVETAPRITDREIIESLTRLDAGQQALAKEMHQRFEAVDQGFASMEKNMDQRFAALDKRLDDQFAMSLLAMFSAIILLIVSLFGYIVWDRRTALRPLETRLAQLEQDLERDLQLRHEQGSLPTRLLNALRDLAQEDEKLARVLRSFSLF